MKSLIQFFLFSSTFLTYALSAPDKKGAYATPEDAAKDPDFSIQGEYEGSYTKGNGTKSKVGIQVVALGNGIFNAVGFEGGLPGNGWDLSERAQSEAKKADDGSVTFKKAEALREVAKTIQLSSKKKSSPFTVPEERHLEHSIGLIEKAQQWDWRLQKVRPSSSTDLLWITGSPVPVRQMTAS